MAAQKELQARGGARGEFRIVLAPTPEFRREARIMVEHFLCNPLCDIGFHVFLLFEARIQMPSNDP